ncbi:MAG: hypothetical protein J6T24_08680 [Clostridia bacterium]|nr:hypothetical protein [Clostridia bacterium]
MKKFSSLCLAVLLLLSSVLGLASCGELKDSGAVINTYYVGEMYDFDPARAVLDDDAMRVMALLYEPLFTLSENGKVVPALAESYKILRDVEAQEYKMEIKLKPSTWSDGNPVRAEDVVYAWQRIIDPNFKSQAAPLLYDIAGAIEAKNAESDEEGKTITVDDMKVTADNRSTLTITFRNYYDADGNIVEIDYDAFLRNLTSLALTPVRQSVVSKAEDYWGKRAVTIVTNGAFTVRTLDYDIGEFTLERNRYYNYLNKDAVGEDPVDKFVKPYQITTLWTTDLATLADAFANNSVFFMSDLPLALRAEVEDDAKVANALSTMTILLNPNDRSPDGYRKSALSDPIIRKAMSAVLDRTAIAETLTFAVPATGFISHGVFDTNSRRTEFREVGGNLLSTTATAKPEGFDAAFDALSAKSKKLTLAYNNTEADKAVAEYVKGVWEEQLGFTVTLVPLKYNDESVTLDLNGAVSQLFFRGSQLIDVYEDFAIGNAAEHLAAYNNESGRYYHNDGQLDKYYFDAVLLDYQMLSTDAFAPLCGFSSILSGNGVDLSTDANGYQSQVSYTHVTSYVNEEYDALIAAALAERDLAKRAEILHDAEEMLLDDMPIIPLTFGQTYYMKSNKLSGLTTTYYGYPLFTRASLKNYQDYLPETPVEEGETEGE